MATSDVEPQEELPRRSEWNGLESTEEHMDFNNATATTYTTDITTASSTIMTTTTSNSSRISAFNPSTAHSATIRADTTTTAAITSSTPTTTDTASTTAAAATTADDFTTNFTTATTISTSDFTTTDPTTNTITSTTTCDLPADTATSDLTTSTSTTTNSSSDLTAITTTTTTTTTTTLTAAIQTDEEQSDENATSAESDHTTEGSEEHVVTSTPTHLRPAPPITLALSGSRPRKRKILLAPALSLTLGQSDSAFSEDFPPAFLSPSPDQEDDTTLSLDLDAMETPSDSESLHFPSYDLDLEDEFRRLGVSSHQQRSGSGSSPRPPRRSKGFGSESGASGPSCLDREDTVDSEGTRWRSFSTGQPEEPPQEGGRVNMSVVEPYLRVLSHGGYYGDGMNDIIVFSSCYLPENSLNNYHYVMDNLFRYVVGTLDLMVAENYVIVYLCAGAQKERLPGISWLRECYTTIHRRLRKNLKGLYVVHPTWFIKAMITIIKPFISSKFSRKLQFVDSLQELSQLIPTEHVQIPDSVRQFDENLNR